MTRRIGLAWLLWSISTVLTAAGLVWLALDWSRPLPDTWGVRGFGALFALTFSGVGLVIAARRPENPIGWLFLGTGVTGAVQLFCEEYAVYSLFANPGALPGSLVLAWIAAWIWVPSMVLVTVFLPLIFPNGRLLSSRWRPVVWVAVAAMVLAIIGEALTPGPLDNAEFAINPLGIEGARDALQTALIAGIALLVTAILLAAASLILRFRRATGDERQQLKWIASAVALTGIALGLNLTGQKVAEVLTIGAVLAIPVAAAIAILRYRLYDIDVLINRTLVYTALTALLGLLYWGTVVLLQHLLRALTGRGEEVAIVASTLAIAALFQPVRRRSQEFIDRRFYRRKYDAATILANFSATARDEVDLSRLTDQLLAVVREAMQPAHVSLWLREPDGPGTAGSGLTAHDPLVLFVQGTPGTIEVDRLDLDSPALRALQAAGTKLMVPLVSQGELIGLLNLGPRLSAQPYTADDRGLLNHLADQAAPAVRVAQLVRERQAEATERERIAHELHVAGLIQQTLLPKQVPALAGWQTAVYYRPAREVGGDFYDFIALPGDRWGLVVGDVTDKGVPAALVMATTRAILRAAAERLESPGAVLERVNNVIHPDIPPKMFVTCLFAVLDPTTGRLRYANAGHDLPYWHHREGVAQLRATGMPLGLFPDMHYEEKEVTVAPGDSLLLYSDGLVEAHAPDREMFGFPRLTTLVEEHPGDETLIDRLLSALTEFVGEGWEQEDDVTLVTLRRCGPAGEGGWVKGSRCLTEFSLPSDAGNERIAIQRVAAAVEGLDLPAARLERLKTAVGEATMNAIEHGNQFRSDLPVGIQVMLSGGDLAVQVSDHAIGAPAPAPEAPDLDLKLAGLQSPRGWGLFLIEKMVDELRVSSEPGRHCVELILHLEGNRHVHQTP